MLVLCAAFIGLLVGTGELIARYRDAPFRALGNVAAIAYILLNAAASALAYEFVRALHIVGTAGADDAVNSGLWEVLAGGFGAMAVFRSSLFTVRIGDTDVGVGPAIFLQVLMGATDRACDRSRAAPRSAAIKAIMTGVEFQKAAAALPAFCFGLMQNVSSQEVRDLSSTVAELRRSEMDDLSKTYSLGLALMNIVGERVLRQAVDTLGGQIKGPARASLEVSLRDPVGRGRRRPEKSCSRPGDDDRGPQSGSAGQGPLACDRIAQPVRPGRRECRTGLRRPTSGAGGPGTGQRRAVASRWRCRRRDGRAMTELIEPH